MMTYVECAGSAKHDLGKSLYNVAFEDVKSAFTVFLQQYCTGDRPFIIAGHSQGSDMAALLIKDMIDTNESLRPRMVCAYLGGVSVGLDTFTHVPPSQSPVDVGCWAAWATTTTEENFTVSAGGYTYNCDGDQEIMATFLQQLGNPGPGPYHQLAELTNRPVSVNPLSWDTKSEKVAMQHNLGSLGADDTIYAGTIGAKASNDTSDRKDGDGIGGVIQVDLGDFKDSRDLLLTPHGIQPTSNDLHECDYPLFWMNLRQNAKDRLAAWMASEEAAAPALVRVHS